METGEVAPGSEYATLERIARGAPGRAGGENFPIAAVVPPHARGALQRIYAYARFVDEVGDAAPGDRRYLLDLVEVDVRAAAAGAARISCVRALGPDLASGLLPEQPLLDLIEANRMDQAVTSYGSFDDLLGYCRLSAAPVGNLVLHLAGAATDENVAASDRVCAGLQIVEHLQDVGEDAGNGRVYLPADELAAAGVSAADLTAPSTSPALRGVLASLLDRAEAMVRDGVPLVSRLRGWARLAVAGYVAGGLATVDALRAADLEVLAIDVTPSRARTALRAAPLLVTKPKHQSALDAAYAECEAITRQQARNFAWGIRLLPTEKRRALSAVYAFARRIDDIGDGSLPEQEKLRLLAQARESALDPGADPDDPVLVALADAAHRLPIPLAAFTELVDGCEMDVSGRSYDTLSELVEYCRCVAGSIGRLSLGVFHPQLGGDGDRAEAEQLADALGVALQLTNILRDIREDLGNGRIYLPKQDLALFDCELRTTADGALDPQGGALAELIRFEAARAAGWYDRGLQLLPLLDRRSAACCAAMAGIYRELLARIAADPGIVMRGRASLSGRDKARIAVRALAGRGA